MRSNKLLICYVLLCALLFVFWVPPWEPPDEPSHVLYINYVARTGRLPNQLAPGESVVGEGHQPPLYYILGALINLASQPDRTVDLQPVRNPKHVWNKGNSWNVPVYKHLDPAIFATSRDRIGFYLLRLLSVGLVLANVWCMFRVFRLFVPVPNWPWFAGLLVVTLPQFLFMSAAIDNDHLANLFATLTIYHSLRILDTPRQARHYGLAGLWLGLGLLTKKTLLFVLPVILLLLAYVVLRQKNARRQALRYGVLLVAIAILVSAPFFVRNYRLYGEFIGTRMERQTLSELVQVKSISSPYFRSTFVVNLALSYVGKFGYMNVPLPLVAYVLYGLLVVAGILGLGLHICQGGWRNARLGFALLFILACLAGIVIYNLTYSMPQGRFLFPVASLIAALLALGWKTLVGRVDSAVAQRIMVMGIGLGLVALDILSILVVYRFYYVAAQYL